MQSPEFDTTPSAWRTGRYLEWYVGEPLAALNQFPFRVPEERPLPDYLASTTLLPQPYWPERPHAIEAYWKAWELAWSNLRQPVAGSGFIANYIDTAFNDCLFMWDSVFILQFGRYAARAFDFQSTLDNFYAKQHPNGFICREIRENDGSDQWHRSVPFATGPNVLAWAEWRHFEWTGDRRRLEAVYPAIAAYHRWTRKNQSWPDGSYWTTGLGCGMDNMARVPEGVDVGQEHGWMTWIDATFQAILSARLLAKIADVLGIQDEIGAREEADRLSLWANENLWDDEAGFYFDRDRSGRLTRVKSVAAFWALLAGVVPADRVDRFVAHLADPSSFNRPHRVPSLAAESAGYVPGGGDYWCGAVWAPTNYMVLRGLSQAGKDDLAYEIAVNHLDNVLRVFEQTGTFWENYGPEGSVPGNPAKRDFVGWSGLPPVAVLLEYVFGIRPAAATTGKWVWDIRLTDEFGVDNYPLAGGASASFRCSARASEVEEPEVSIRSDDPIEVDIRWKGGTKSLRV